MGAFVISKRYNDEFVFTPERESCFTSLSYELKFECEKTLKFKATIGLADFEI
jgi:hypothetical protein